MVTIVLHARRSRNCLALRPLVGGLCSSDRSVRREKMMPRASRRRNPTIHTLTIVSNQRTNQWNLGSIAAFMKNEPHRRARRLLLPQPFQQSKGFLIVSQFGFLK